MKKNDKDKRIANGTKVSWPTPNRWGKRTKKAGKVVAFVPRGKSAAKATPKGAKLRGPAVSTLNDRYLVQHADGSVTAPRAPTLERHAA